MRIALFSSGRFHLCDLARELLALGHSVKFYSLVPPWRMQAFGVPAGSSKWMARYLVPELVFLSVARKARTTRRMRQRLTVKLDKAVAKRLEPCDVFIGMSGMSNCVAMRAKELSAQVRIQRCSRHILSQQAILSQLPNAEQVSEFDIERETRDYDIADVIDVPSEHCRESFLQLGFHPDRLFCNHFGVNLSSFKPTTAPDGVPTFIMVGTWSLRKGCDVLLEAWRGIPGTRLMHVGPVGDMPLPNDEGFEHHDSVPQSDLPKYYAQAHVKCLASREEGLAFVQPQALACGLPLVCTSKTGGADLKECVFDRSDICVVEENDAIAFRSGMQLAISKRESTGVLRDRLSASGRSELSWEAYAIRLLKSIETVGK